MSAGREILTLQLGHYSNYIGAHWWNTQEASFTYDGAPSEINHDVLFREGRTEKNEVTFTPRVLAVDLKGSLGSLPEYGTLYGEGISNNKLKQQWDGKVDVHQLSPIEKNQYLKDLDEEENQGASSSNHRNQTPPSKSYKLEDTVTVWSDYLSTRFHPRSLYLLKQYTHNDTVTPFETFSQGLSLWKESDVQEEFTDRIRSYVEECDWLQGFHIVLDHSNGFSGYSHGVLTHLQDEYSTKPTVAFPVCPTHFENTTHQHNCNQTLNTLFTYQLLARSSSLFIPLGLNRTVLGFNNGTARIWRNVEYNAQLQYHTSALLSTALETITLPYRLHNKQLTLSDITDLLTPRSYKAAAITLQIPAESSLTELIRNSDSYPICESVTPGYNTNMHNETWVELVSSRGFKEGLKASEDVLRTMLIERGHRHENSVVCAAQNGVTVNKAFPNVVKTVSKDKTFPVVSGIENGPSVGTMLKSLADEVKRRKMNHFQQFFDSGIEKDEFEDVRNDYIAFYEDYLQQ